MPPKIEPKISLPPLSKKAKIGLIVGGVITAILVIVGIVLGVTFGGKKDEGSQDNKPVTPALSTDSPDSSTAA